jgi:hypothetical protein
MLVIADGLTRAAFALQAPDGTILLSQVDEDAGHVHRLAHGSRVHHPEHGEMTVVPVLIVVTAAESM